MSHLIEFYGEECPHCIKMKPMIENIEKDLGVQVDSLEVWHNEENLKLLETHDKGFCGGVPFLINTQTGKWICGEATEEELKAWAKE